MPKHPLPSNPSLEHLRKQAKRLLDAARSGDETARALIAEHHPRPPETLALHDAQLALARLYDFASWPKLVEHIHRVEPHAWDPLALEDPTDPAALLLRLACLDYGRWMPSDLDRARTMLAGDPSLARANVFTAAATGEVDALRAFLDEDPARANATGGPYTWPPLLYACYSRLAPTLACARVLLDAGADPDAGFLWCGNVPPNTALTGAFGEGEGGHNQPPHLESEALARALLDAGADPNDGQTLYNKHFRSDDGYLRILFEYGLGTERGGPWIARFRDRMGGPQELVAEEVWNATKHDYVDRVRLLAEHGTLLDLPGRRDGRTPYELAMLLGNKEIAAYLVAHGAKPRELPLRDRFASALIGGDRDTATALLAAHPELHDTDDTTKCALVVRAVEANHPEGVRLMAELGFPLSLVVNNHATPLHQAAWGGDLEMVKLLVSLGARTDVRDPNYDGTPLGWAKHNQQMHVVGYLTQFEPSS